MDKLRKALQALADAIERDGDPAFAHLLIEARAALAEPVADEPVYGWYTPCKAPHWYSPVFAVGAEPPSPLTRERAVALGWIPVYTRPAATAPAERGGYPPLPEPDTRWVIRPYRYTADQMRAYVDSDRAQRVPLTSMEFKRIYAQCHRHRCRR